MRNEPTIIDLSQGWALEDSRRSRCHSEAELTATSNVLWGDCGDPARRADRIRQFATTTGSASVLIADVAARQMQTLYRHSSSVMKSVVRTRKNIPNYNSVEATRFEGAESTLPLVKENGEYPQITVSQEQTERYFVGKHGALFEATEESITNDPVGVFNTLPERMVRGALRSEEAFMTSLFFDAGGPIDAFYSAQPSGPSSLPLTIDNLATAVGQMLGYTDTEGDPIISMPKFLMVGPGLMIKAMQLLNSISLNHVVDGSGSGPGVAESHGTKNVLSDLGIKLLVNPWIPVLSTSGTIGSTCWSLFTDPANIPAGEFGTLVGYDAPQVSAPDARDIKRIQTDVLTWKVKHVFGGTRLDPRAVWGSFGQ